MFSNSGKVYIASSMGQKHVQPQDPSRAGPVPFSFSVEQIEVHTIEAGNAEPVSGGGPFAEWIGMTPNGEFLARREITRAGIRFPAIFVVTP